MRFGKSEANASEFDKARWAARSAWIEEGDRVERLGLAGLNPEPARPEGFPENWSAAFLGVLTTDPVFLFADKDKAGCELLAAYFEGPPKVDWAEVARVAESAYEARAKSLGVDSTLHNYRSETRGQGDETEAGSERIAWMSPAFGSSSFSAMFEGPAQASADRRRSARRRGRPVPEAWAKASEATAEASWRAGISARGFFKEAGTGWRGDWAESAWAFAEGLSAAGARFVWRVPHFFERRPGALGLFGMEAGILESGLDPIVSGWEIDEASGRGVEVRRPAL